MQPIKPRPVFLTAEWRRLIMANYEIDPAVLQAFVPFGTELDTWQGRHYVSLVGFMFLDTRLKGIPIPFHRNFEEINLRFYVRYQDPELGWKRGTVFIKEIVPKAAITLVANTFYGEHYVTMPTRHRWEDRNGELLVEYGWKQDKDWQHIRVIAEPEPEPLQTGAEAEFITEHYWGYVRRQETRSTEYQVEHPAWRIHQVKDYEVKCNAEQLYGPGFGAALSEDPLSVFMAEGSKVIVREGKKIR
jgi:hypothetical protein